jgi:hypothetical protein
VFIRYLDPLAGSATSLGGRVAVFTESLCERLVSVFNTFGMESHATGREEGSAGSARVSQ